MIAVKQSRPQIDLPSQTPTGADIPAQFEGFLCGGEEIRRVAQINLIRMIAGEMHHNYLIHRTGKNLASEIDAAKLYEPLAMAVSRSSSRL